MLRPIAVPAVLALLLGACLGSSRTAGPPAHDDLSDADVAMAARAMHEALENLPDRQTLGWRNQTSGYGGSFRPYRTYVSSTGLFCRQYAEELLRDGQKSTSGMRRAGPRMAAGFGCERGDDGPPSLRVIL